jgi:hypothetical protein
MITLKTVSQVDKRSVFVYELVGMVFIILLGSMLHFTFELSGGSLLVGVFSAVNESVWEHLKLVFWPALLFMFIEYMLLRKRTISNFALAKTAGVYLAIVIIPAIFYSYTAITGESIFLMDISTFVVAVIVGQLLSYRVLAYGKLSEGYDRISLVLLVLLGFAFVLFTFYPPLLIVFRDPVTGRYGIP